MNKLTEALLSVDEDWSNCTPGGRCQDPGGIYDSNLDQHVMNSEQLTRFEQAILDWIDKEIIGRPRPEDSTIYTSRKLREMNGFDATNQLIIQQRKKLGR